MLLAMRTQGGSGGAVDNWVRRCSAGEERGDGRMRNPPDKRGRGTPRAEGSVLLVVQMMRTSWREEGK